MIIIVKIISDGGIPSKNFPNYSETSFLLACNKDYVSGFKVDIYVTKDCKFVLVNEEVLKKIGISEEYVRNHTYKDIKNINYGSKIKLHYLVNLEYLFKICKKNKYLIINIRNKYLNDKETEYLNRLLIENNSDTLLVSSSSNQLLKKIDNNLNKGLIINSEKDWEYSYFFYITKEKYLTDAILNEKTKSNTLIFINCNRDCDSVNKYNYKNIYIISPYSNSLNN